MSQQKHTPGPWHIDFDDCEADIHSGFGMVAKTMGHGKEQDDEGRANARLIAAAPELLEALEALVNDFGRDGYGVEFKGGECCVIDMARAVIAKTTRGGK